MLPFCCSFFFMFLPLSLFPLFSHYFSSSFHFLLSFLFLFNVVFIWPKYFSSVLFFPIFFSYQAFSSCLSDTLNSAKGGTHLQLLCVPSGVFFFPSVLHALLPSLNVPASPLTYLVFFCRHPAAPRYQTPRTSRQPMTKSLSWMASPLITSPSLQRSRPGECGVRD